MGRGGGGWGVKVWIRGGQKESVCVSVWVWVCYVAVKVGE